MLPGAVSSVVGMWSTWISSRRRRRGEGWDRGARREAGTVALGNPLQEGLQIGAGQEIALSHLRARCNALNERLGAPGLQLKEPFDVLAFVMGANGVLHRATNFRESREPRNRAGHGKPLP